MFQPRGVKFTFEPQLEYWNDGIMRIKRGNISFWIRKSILKGPYSAKPNIPRFQHSSESVLAMPLFSDLAHRTGFWRT